MTQTMTTLVTVMWLLVGQAAVTPPPQQDWLKAFAGTWVPEGPAGDSGDAVLTVTLEGQMLVLKSALGNREIRTRYDLSGADLTNTNFSRPAVFRTRVEGQKVVTDIWDGPAAVGPPARIETRFLESPDRMVGELRRTPDGPVFNRGALRRK